MRYLLDTSALLAHHRQESGWETVQVLFETDEHMRAIPPELLHQNDLGAPTDSL